MQDDEQFTAAEVAELEGHFKNIEGLFRYRMRERREELGWSQTRLADEAKALDLHLDGTAITRIEGGKRSVRLDEAWALAAVLRMPLEGLLPSTLLDVQLRIDELEQAVVEGRHRVESQQRWLKETEQRLKALRQTRRAQERRGGKA